MVRYSDACGILWVCLIIRDRKQCCINFCVNFKASIFKQNNFCIPAFFHSSFSFYLQDSNQLLFVSQDVFLSSICNWNWTISTDRNCVYKLVFNILCKSSILWFGKYFKMTTVLHVQLDTIFTLIIDVQWNMVLRLHFCM